jgi:DNA-binding IclR family transcriptional regulator
VATRVNGEDTHGQGDNGQGDNGQGDNGQGSDRRESVAGRISLLIDAFDAGSPTLSLSQLTERCGLPKSTVHRMADQLIDLRWLERGPTGYRLGIRFFEIGGLVAARNHLRERALPWLSDLQSATGCAVHLGLLEGIDVVILEKVWGHGAATLPTRIGGRMPAYCTAAGKALLAYAGDTRISEAIAGGLVARTGHTIIVPEVLRAELGRVRANGWALESEENVRGLACVAAPIRGAGRAVAAVSVSGPVERIEINRVAPLVRRAATDIWGQLFSRRPTEASREQPVAWNDDGLRHWFGLQADDWM